MHYLLLHGTGGTPTNVRFPRLRTHLEKQGHLVSTPVLPEADNPQWKMSRDYILDNFVLDIDTVLIGHSSGATLILSLLDAIDTSIAKAILIAGYVAPLPEIERTKLMIQESYDRKKIQHNADEIIFINSDNDPYGCDDIQARPLAERLGATFVFAKGMGHMGSGKFNDPCKELPLLLPYL